MRLDEIEVIVAAGRGISRIVQDALAKIFEELQSSGATRLLSAIDVCHAQLAATAIGMFSLYEARLQTNFGWNDPFKMLQEKLTQLGESDLAENFENLRLAINTLKYGEGRSHTTLLERVQDLPFAVRDVSDSFCEEGDVCPLPDLVEASPEFLEACCDVVEASWAKVRA